MAKKITKTYELLTSRKEVCFAETGTSYYDNYSGEMEYDGGLCGKKADTVIKLVTVNGFKKSRTVTYFGFCDIHMSTKYKNWFNLGA